MGMAAFVAEGIKPDIRAREKALTILKERLQSPMAEKKKITAGQKTSFKPGDVYMRKLWGKYAGDKEQINTKTENRILKPYDTGGIDYKDRQAVEICVGIKKRSISTVVPDVYYEIPIFAVYDWDENRTPTETELDRCEFLNISLKILNILII